jgi:hypothetical protein
MFREWHGVGKNLRRPEVYSSRSLLAKKHPIATKTKNK